MGAPAVPTVEDEELYERLKHRPEELLCRVFNHFYFERAEDYCDPDEYDPDGWRRLLAGELPEETRSWLQTHAKLAEESVDRVHTIAYLNEKYDVPEGKRDPGTLYELAVLIHELGADESLPEIIVSARVKQNEMKRTWVLDEQLSLTNLSGRIESFHELWNNNKNQSKAVLVRQELSGDSITSIQFISEKGSEPAEKSTFAFRENEEERIPRRPELTTVSYRELKNIRSFIKVESDRTFIVFTKDHRRSWTNVLDMFFEHVFGVDSVTDSFQKRAIDDATELQDEAHDSFELSDEPIEQVATLIDDRSDEAIDAVDKSSLGPKRKEIVKSKLRSIELSGSEIEDDPNLGTEEFRLIGRNNLDEVFEQVDIEDSFLQFLSRASDESLALVLNVDGRHVAARQTGPQPIDGSRLGSETELALSYFFDQEAMV